MTWEELPWDNKKLGVRCLPDGSYLQVVSNYHGSNDVYHICPRKGRNVEHWEGVDQLTLRCIVHYLCQPDYQPPEVT